MIRNTFTRSQRTLLDALCSTFSGRNIVVRHIRFQKCSLIGQFLRGFCFSDACVSASACQEFVTRKLRKFSRTSFAKQNAKHQSLQWHVASRFGSAYRRQARYRHWKSCHQEIQQPRNMVMVAFTAITTLLSLP